MLRKSHEVTVYGKTIERTQKWHIEIFASNEDLEPVARQPI